MVGVIVGVFVGVSVGVTVGVGVGSSEHGYIVLHVLQSTSLSGFTIIPPAPPSSSIS